MRSLGRPEPATGDMGLCGVYYAIVTQNKDEEKKMGRVKVRFPWLPGGDKDQSHWAQIAVPMSGDKFGTFVLPEVEDTVLVVFMAGNINHPVVIGGMWNKVDKPPEINEDGKNDFRLIKSRAGHRFMFDDTDKTKVVLTDYTNTNYFGVGMYAEAGGSSNKMELQTPQAINGTPEKGVAMCSMEGTFNIWCPNGTLKVEAKHIEFTASDKADVKAGGKLKLEGKSNAKNISTQASKYEGSTIKVGP